MPEPCGVTALMQELGARKYQSPTSRTTNHLLQLELQELLHWIDTQIPAAGIHQTTSQANK